MTPERRDTILTFAILPACAALVFSGIVWWYERGDGWLGSRWHAIFPPATALGAFVIGAVVGWIYARAVGR
jgi:hypothetical protein